MRYSPAHAAKSGSVPFMLRGPKSARMVLSAAVAGVLGLVPTVMVSSPAMAAVIDGVYSIANTSGTEGGLVTFTITRAAPTGTDTLAAETVNWATSDGTAVAGSDYTAVTAGSVTGTVSFPAYSNTTVPQTRSISVQTLQDTTDEADDENFTVTLTSSTGSPDTTFANGGAAIGTIVDDDNPTFTLQSAPATVNESLATADRHATITATLSRPSPFPISIPISTADGTAKAPQDYVALDDAISIPANAPGGDIQVLIEDDDVDEAGIQSFTVGTRTAPNVSGTQSVTVNIADDDDAPRVILGAGGQVTEGGTLNFNVTLDGQSENTVTARWDTADGAVGTPAAGHSAAKAGDDYTAVTNGTVTFAPLSTTPTTPITVKTSVDAVDEATEDLQVKLSDPSNGTLGTPTAVTGSILDSGTTPGPQVTLTPTKLDEGGLSTPRSRTFTVKLSKASGREQKVSYAVASGQADAGAGIGSAQAFEDFMPTLLNGSLTFAPGETEKTFTVDILGDNVDEGNGENIAITLSDVNGGLAAGLSLTTNQVTITDDDNKPVMSLVKSDMTMPEGDGPTPVLFELHLSNPSAEDVDWVVAPATSPAGTAWPGDDYTLVTPLRGEFTAGQTTSYVLLVVNGDKVYEPTETVRYTVSRFNDDADATGGPLNANLTITNDDTAPELEVTSANTEEGKTLGLSGVVTGESQTDTLLNITLAGRSQGGKQAASANDFSPTSFQVTIPAYTSSGSVVPIGDVVIADDTTNEPAETVLVNGTGFAGTGTVKDGVITNAASDGGTPPTNPADGDITLLGASSITGAGTVDLSGVAAVATDLTLWGKAVGAPAAAPWENLGTTRTDAKGAYAFTPSLTTTGYWFKVSAGDTESATLKVNLKEDPAFTARSASKGKVTLSVVGDPKVRGLSVRVLRANSDGTWTTVGTGILNASGAYTKTISGTSGKSYTFKATVYGDGDVGLLTNTSKSASVKVR
jgi:hypothetical protein